MRVGIDLTCWANRRGYGRFARGLVSALLATADGNDYVLLLDAQTADRSDLPSAAERVVLPTRRAPAEAASATGSRSLRDLWAMTRAASRQELDVLFYPTVYTWFPVTVFSRSRRPTVILGIHDVIAEDYPAQVFPQPYRRLLWTTKSWLARRQADHLMTVSEHARRGILRQFDHPEDSVHVVGEAADPEFQPLGSEPLDGELLGRCGLSPEGRYLVYLGGFNPHKNLDRLLRALASARAREDFANLELILVGDTERDHFTPGLEALRRTIASLDLEHAVHFTGFLEDAALRHVFALARALVLPSLAEGFGLPAVEAAACGTPVIATVNSPLPELLRGGGLFCDPLDTEALEGAIRRLTGDRALREELAAGALDRARAMSWSRSADQFREMLTAIGEGRR